MAKKKAHAGGGGHSAGWVVTFADLVALLMAFFVMIVSFSVQEQEKIAQAAGSIREAFGVQPVRRPAGMIEQEGLPVRKFLRQMGVIDAPADSEFADERNDQRAKQGPEANTHNFERSESDKPRQFISAAVAIRQALADEPDIAELSRQVIVEENEEGLNIRLVDHDGRSMFGQGSAEPAPGLRLILKRLAPVIAELPNRIRISGHTASDRNADGFGTAAWRLSAERGLATAELLAAEGLSVDHVESVLGRADTEPLFPNDPFLSANRRIEILVLHEAPPFPVSNGD